MDMMSNNENIVMGTVGTPTSRQGTPYGTTHNTPR